MKKMGRLKEGELCDMLRGEGKGEMREMIVRGRGRGGGVGWKEDGGVG